MNGQPGSLQDLMSQPGMENLFLRRGQPNLSDVFSQSMPQGGSWPYGPGPSSTQPGASYGAPFRPSPAPPPDGSQAPTPATKVSEQTGETSDPYEEMVTNYLHSLMTPVNLPPPPPLTGLQAMAVTLNPEHRQELLQHFNAPYEAQKQNIMLNLQRQGQAGSLAGQLMEKKEQDRLRKAQLEFQVYQKNWAREQAASNAGVTNFPYTIPGMGESAQANARYKGARTSYWERGNQPHATGRFKSKADYLAFLDNQLFKTRSQFFAATAGPLATGESATDIQAKIDDPNTPEKERSYYRTQLPMAGMTEEVQQAHDELKNRVIPAINAMPEAAFPEFMSKSGAEQAEIIELLLKRPLSPSGRRIIMEGSTATPLQPSPPPEEQEGASGWPF